MIATTNESGKIVQTLKISNWCDFSFSDIGNTEGMEKTTICTVAGGMPCKITTFLDESGEGFEIREYTPKN